MLARIGYFAFLLCAAAGVAAAQPRDIGSGLPEVTAPQTDATVRDVRVQVVTVLNTTIGAPMPVGWNGFPCSTANALRKATCSRASPAGNAKAL